MTDLGKDPVEAHLFAWVIGILLVTTLSLGGGLWFIGCHLNTAPIAPAGSGASSQADADAGASK